MAGTTLFWKNVYRVALKALKKNVINLSWKKGKWIREKYKLWSVVFCSVNYTTQPSSFTVSQSLDYNTITVLNLGANTLNTLKLLGGWNIGSSPLPTGTLWPSHPKSAAHIEKMDEPLLEAKMSLSMAEIIINHFGICMLFYCLILLNNLKTDCLLLLPHLKDEEIEPPRS